MIEDKMKLTIELVPQTSWFSNLRSLLSQAEWDVIRKQCYKKAGYKCEICNEVGPKHPVECHETWDYDNGIQKLIGLIALCPNCHKTKHYGFARISGNEKEVKKHFMKVNSLSEKEADDYIENAFLEWERKSELQWKLDISFLESYKLL